MSLLNAFYGSLRPSPAHEGGKVFLQHVRAMLLQQDHRMVLMKQTSGEWDLPKFIYDNVTPGGLRTKPLCRDFAQWMGQDVHFVAVVELLGDACLKDWTKDPPDRTGLNLVLMESANVEVEELTLPKETEWKDAGFLSDLIESMGEEEDERNEPFEVVLSCIKPESTILSDIEEPRFQLGYFKKASDFLASVMKEDCAELEGPVRQEDVSGASTILIGNSSKGRYFLKAPAWGINEVEITEKIESLFEGRSVEVVAKSVDLNCFVTREFIHVYTDEKDMLLALGRMQLESIKHMEELKKAGCVVRDLESTGELVYKWAFGGETEQEGDLRLWMEISQSACYLMYVCRRLKELKIPLTLNHGDLSSSNATYNPVDSDNVMLFDWEFAYISHPFFDLFREVGEIPEDAFLPYLELWTDYADLETLKGVYKQASILGSVQRICSLWDRVSKCKHQSSPWLQEWVRLEAFRLSKRAEREKSLDEEYLKSFEAEIEKTKRVCEWYCVTE